MKNMEKVSAKEFFTVMWSGLCQALGWFFGLFGYKRDGKYAKCVWGLFATSAAFIMGIIAIVIGYAAFDEASDWYNSKFHSCDEPYCYENTYISREIYFHDHGDGKGYIYNVRTGEKCLKHVKWIAKPTGKDSLICFSNGKKRGYFSKNTGKVIIEPKYNHAWIFSDGLASVDEGGYIKFIDGTGKVVIDKQMPYIPNMEGYVFHGGYCVVETSDGNLCGLMDTTGKMVLPPVYTSIIPTNDFKLWRVKKGEEMAVVDQELNPIIPLTKCTIYGIDEGTIDITMPDHTMRKYDLQGTLINDFYISSLRTLEYEKDEIHYTTKTYESDGEEYAEPTTEYYHPKATARLRAYTAGDGYEGLMTADGHIVTMPLYSNIEAIGYDLYLCEVSNGDKVIVNGKGNLVKNEK